MAGLVQKTYANSLFEVALEANQLQAVFDELATLKGLLTDDYVKILKTPVIERNIKQKLINDAFKGKVCPIVFNFLSLLIDNDRFSFVFSIIDEFNNLYNIENGILEVEAITATDISWELKARLIARLEGDTKKTIRLKSTVDPSILGGIKLRYNNTEVDSSIKSKLETIRQSIKQVTL